MSAEDKSDQRDVEGSPDVEPSDGVEIDKIADDTDEPQHDEESAADDATSWIGGKVTRSQRAIVVPLVLVLLLLVSGALATWLYVKQYRPDEQTGAAARSVVDAARDGTVALLSYKPDTFNQDFDAARSHLTGDFLNSYDQLARQVLTPAAKEKKVTTTAQVVAAAPYELHPDSAVVLLFINQATVSQDRPDPAMESSSVLVSLTKLHGKWLITNFQPI